MTKHSPTPWHCGMDQDGYPELWSADGVQVENTFINDPLSVANYEFIVTAVNSYAMLIEFVKAVLPRLEMDFEQAVDKRYPTWEPLDTLLLINQANTILKSKEDQTS